MVEKAIEEICKRCKPPESPSAQFCERCGASPRGQEAQPSPREGVPLPPLQHDAPQEQPPGYPS
ncbi:MAG: hypothetical protein WCE81_08150 [Halobacteriota archaeon]